MEKKNEEEKSYAFEIFLRKYFYLGYEKETEATISTFQLIQDAEIQLHKKHTNQIYDHLITAL